MTLLEDLKAGPVKKASAIDTFIEGRTDEEQQQLIAALNPNSGWSAPALNQVLAKAGLNVSDNTVLRYRKAIV